MNAHNAALGGTPQRLKRGIPLALRGVARRFGEREVLKDIDLLVPAGQFVAIVGRSGCGKSTLLRLLAGLDQPSRGELLAGSAALAEAREDTRLMFQDSRLLPWKRVIDNVGLGLRGDWRANLPVELPRPRSRGSARLAALEAEVLNRVLAQPELPPQPEPVSPLPTQLRWAL
ncbi:ATP-binding cassette domain-containing protein [Pseudomonas aeruginosa]|uniref:ATP-binding cassette domain-containing protein n=1 Tax=Pseudomonas aeruginosa TaxID=287 RepID=UPI00104EDC07|nr:ATP-binding cassette domain-containing protein [Pseudomonas aeruginosa]